LRGERVVCSGLLSTRERTLDRQRFLLMRDRKEEIVSHQNDFLRYLCLAAAVSLR